jgi:hypothetical protein
MVHETNNAVKKCVILTYITFTFPHAGHVICKFSRDPTCAVYVMTSKQQILGRMTNFFYSTNIPQQSDQDSRMLYIRHLRSSHLESKQDILNQSSSASSALPAKCQDWPNMPHENDDVFRMQLLGVQSSFTN